MRRFCLILAPLALAVPSAPASAQSSFMPDMIGQAVAGMYRNSPTPCYDGHWAAKPKNMAKGIARADALMQRYREGTALGPDVRKLFITSQARWQHDGQRQKVRNLSDPWIGRVARLDRTALTPSNWDGYYHVQWKAYAADGTYIGLYDALLNSNGSQFTWMDLISAGSTIQPAPDVPFCNEPGDVEAWHEAKALRAAKKAAARDR